MFAEDGYIEDPIGVNPTRGHDALRRFYDITINQGKIRDSVGTLVAAHDGRHVAVPVTADMANIGDPDRKRVTVNAVMTFQIGEAGLIEEARTFWGVSDVSRGFLDSPIDPARRQGGTKMASRSVVPTAAQVGTFYDRTNHLLTRYFGGSMHYGYWHGPEDNSSFDEASVRFTDMMISTLGCRGPSRVLDVGCGTGRPAVQLARSTGSRVLGISVSARDVERANCLARAEEIDDLVRFEVVDAMQLPFDAASFDAAWAFESLGHVQDRRQVLAEIRRVLRPGARFALSDAFERAPVADEIRDDYDNVLAAWHAAPLIDRSAYEQLIVDSGFELDTLVDVSDHIVYSYPRIFQALMASREDREFPPELEELAEAYETLAHNHVPTVESSGYLVIGAHTPA